MTELRDIFGGTTDPARMRVNGHFWVALDTPKEHCMVCRQGPTTSPCPGHNYCVCGEPADAHQPGHAAATCTYQLDVSRKMPAQVST